MAIIKFSEMFYKVITWSKKLGNLQDVISVLVDRKLGEGGRERDRWLAIDSGIIAKKISARIVPHDSHSCSRNVIFFVLPTGR